LRLVLSIQLAVREKLAASTSPPVGHLGCS